MHTEGVDDLSARDAAGRSVAVPTCTHSPLCPAADGPDREAAHVLVAHPEQGWSLLCNGIVLFDDTGELLPDCSIIAPHRPTDVHPEMFTRLART